MQLMADIVSLSCNYVICFVILNTNESILHYTNQLKSNFHNLEISHDHNSVICVMIIYYIVVLTILSTFPTKIQVFAT